MLDTFLTVTIDYFREEPFVRPVSVLVTLVAFYRFGRTFYNFVNNPTPWAKGMQMTADMVRRVDVTIMVFSLFLFYVAVTALYGVPSGITQFWIDAAMQIAFIFTLLTLMDWNRSDLMARGGISGPPRERRAYLNSLYAKRGLTVLGMGWVVLGLVAKYSALQAHDWATLVAMAR